MNSEILQVAQNAKTVVVEHMSIGEKKSTIGYDFVIRLFNVESETPLFNEIVFDELVQNNANIRPAAISDPDATIVELAYRLNHLNESQSGVKAPRVFEPLFALFSFFHRLNEQPHDSEFWNVSFSSAGNFFQTVLNERNKLKDSLDVISAVNFNLGLNLKTYLDLSKPDIGLDLNSFKLLNEIQFNFPHQKLLNEQGREFIEYRKSNDVLKLDELAIAFSEFRVAIEGK